MKKFSSTMRGSYRRTSQIKKRIGTFVIVGLIAVILLWFIPRFFSGAASLVLIPIQASKTWLAESSANLPSYLRDRKELINENQGLKEELAIKSGSEHSLELLIRENKELRSLLGDEAEERILAAIIGRPDELPYDVLMIDRGSEHGVVVGAPVYVGNHQVVGVVVKTFSGSSLVELVTTPGFISSVFIVGPDIYTNAVGMGGGQMRVGVPQGIKLEVGNSVILPAIDRGVFGTINHIESLPTQPEQYGFVSTDLPLQSLRYVAVGSAPVDTISFEEAQAIVREGLSDLFTVPVPEGVLVVTDSSTTTATSSAESATGTISNNELEP